MPTRPRPPATDAPSQPPPLRRPTDDLTSPWPQITPTPIGSPEPRYREERRQSPKAQVSVLELRVRPLKLEDDYWAAQVIGSTPRGGWPCSARAVARLSLTATPTGRLLLAAIWGGSRRARKGLQRQSHRSTSSG